MRRVLSNLVENAINYSPEGTTITLTSKEEGGMRFPVSVSDQGPGIAPDEQEKVFTKFYRGQTSETGTSQGHGLGALSCEVLR